MRRLVLTAALITAFSTLSSGQRLGGLAQSRASLRQVASDISPEAQAQIDARDLRLVGAMSAPRRLT